MECESKARRAKAKYKVVKPARLEIDGGTLLAERPVAILNEVVNANRKERLGGYEEKRNYFLRMRRLEIGIDQTRSYNASMLPSAAQPMQNKLPLTVTSCQQSHEGSAFQILQPLSIGIEMRQGFHRKHTF